MSGAIRRRFLGRICEVGKFLACVSWPFLFSFFAYLATGAGRLHICRGPEPGVWGETVRCRRWWGRAPRSYQSRRIQVLVREGEFSSHVPRIYTFHISILQAFCLLAHALGRFLGWHHPCVVRESPGRNGENIVPTLCHCLRPAHSNKQYTHPIPFRLKAHRLVPLRCCSWRVVSSSSDHLWKLQVRGKSVWYIKLSTPWRLVPLPLPSDTPKSHLQS